MSTTAASSPPFDRQEPIPGYRTENLLGRGGYGEVWRAIAPGGIPKAVKIVFGEANSANAETEMRALSRIKDVRHPLLLSIERIEVTHGNLVIVTELADRSLMDHFSRLRQAQAIGVPQDELLRFVGDAGEALDFLYDSYSLQHLDVKPENILIIGGRAKLGDFGLVKNLYERGGSEVGGLTPTYAPPELFEGRPTRQSDQYSLAIVYVHMLTGGLPFQANSTAEMATQHLRGIPDLSALPRPQRSVIARALSKDPSLRFASCTAMVAALKDAAHKSDPLPAAGSGFAMPATAMKRGANAAGDRQSKTDNRTLPTKSKSGLGGENSAGTALPAMPIDDAIATTRPCPPVILVGVGGAGVAILGRIVERLNDRFGNPADWPAVEFLALDSNTKTLSSRFKEADLERVQVVPIPLKPAESYGSQAGNYLKWLGRRWFYNIPRDLTTGGYRPLGRLALLTHGQRVREGVATAVSRSSDREVAGRGSQMKNSTPRDSTPPRVIVIGSIGGGTGSGAILDVAYALRSELKRRGLSDEQVHGVLLHAEPKCNADRDKARSNAYAMLSELHHFSTPGSHFPGEPLLDIPPFHGDNATFAGTHLLLLGGSQGEAEWELATDQAAEFVYGVAFTPAARIFDAPPAIANDFRGGVNIQAHLQSYHVLSFGAGGSPTVHEAIRLARNDVIRLWRQGSPPVAESNVASPGVSSPAVTSPSNRTAILNSFAAQPGFSETQATAVVKQQFTQLTLELPDLLADAAEVVKLEVGEGDEQFLSKLVDDCLATTHDNPAGPERTVIVLAMIDRLLQAELQEGCEGPGDDQLFAQTASRLAVRTRGRINSLLDWIRGFVNAAEVRIEGARKHAVAAQQRLQSLHENALTLASELHKKVIEIGMTAQSDQMHGSERSRFAGWSLRRKKPDDKLRECLKSYSATCLDELLHRTVAKVARMAVAEVSTLIEQLDRLSRDLNRLVGPSQSSSPTAQNARRETEEEMPEGSARELVAYRRLLREQLRIRRHEIACEIDSVIERQLSANGQCILTFLDSEAELQRSLGRPLDAASRQAVLSCIRGINAQLISACSTESECQALRHLAALIMGSLAPTADAPHSDVVERILVIPDEADCSALRARLSSHPHAASIVQGRQCDVTLCSVRQAASLERAADEIIEGVEQYKELAKRLHTRVDLAWLPFKRTEAMCDALNYGSSQSSDPTHTVVIANPRAVLANASSEDLVCAGVVPGVF
jgi:serine/threonine protein kinase